MATHTSATPVRPHDARATRREWAALSVLVLAVVLLAVDGTVLSLAVPSLTQELQPNSAELLWIGDSYGFALAGLLITMGTLADRIGRKKLLLIGSAGFGIASILAAFAPSPGWLIVARVLLGITAATLMPSTLSIIRNIFVNPAQRTRAIAIWSAAAGGGAALGPLVGGILLEHFWWGSVFLINVPIMLVLIVAGFFLIPESRDPNPGKFDLLSAVLSLAAIVGLVFAVKHSANEGFDLVAVLIIVFAVGSGYWFIKRQQSLASPLIDITLFKMPAFSGAVAANFISVFAFSGLLFFFSQYLQFVRGSSPLIAGLQELPVTLASIVIVAFIGMLVARFGRGRSIGLGLAAAAIGFVVLAIAEGIDGYLWLALALVLVGLGVGLALTLTTDAVMSAVPSEKAGSASAISETAYELGVAMGIAILGTLVTLLYRGALVLPAGLSAHERDAAQDSLASASTALSAGSEALEAAHHAFVGAMQVSSIVAAVVLLIAGIMAWIVIPSGKNDSAESVGH